ncbi:hypothetical protein [Streptomyces sp. AM 2-1-1]|uniref:hypothetical protein n=1 Tax=Streptomyces sp. AM 2-1-1 TaxID=3028709 RepID=UPI0023B940FE|nr:hypothetical protein [Streptomyces sp. AM 2-1-1]WEH43990.1 hypothetical protein PZB77_30985 [Streptomyces sp. AM 2-1-1]
MIGCEAKEVTVTLAGEERAGNVRRDKRQIQTAVLGSADSEEPLVLPLEAIELDAFRTVHERDSFWCGLLLGGCGGRLTTKLYTDRVCHFAHVHPGPDGQPHICGRRARGISSADHLYVKSAAAAWFRNRGEEADIAFAQPSGAPVGSLVDITSRHRRLRVHLDQVVEPVWDDDGIEPVLGMSVPVDRDTLIRRWYVHRIRLDSKGTARRVQIGTEAFARPVEWFELNTCTMTERGLSTPAVEKIIRSRTSRPAPAWTAGRARNAPAWTADTAHKAPDAERPQVLLCQLADARKVGAVVVVSRLCDQIAEVTGAEEETQAQLGAAVADARRWLEQQTEVRRSLLADLDAAVAAGRTQRVRTLLTHVNMTAGPDRTEEEIRVVGAAADHVASVASAAAERVHALLEGLRSLPQNRAKDQLRPQVQQLIQAAAQVGRLLGQRQQIQIAAWKVRAGLDKPAPAQTAAPRTPVGWPQQRPQLHKQVARRHWIKTSCPRCRAGSGQECVIGNGSRTRQVRHVPHDERLQPIIDERRERQRNQPKPPPPWRVYEVTCPDCGQGADARCTTTGGPHRSRVERAKEFTRLRKPRPETGTEA